MPEYAFDVKLFAVVRVKAPDEAAARAALEEIECVDLSRANIDLPDGVEITEASLAADDSSIPQGAELIEIDGEDVS
jgi:hypothetical protein